MTSLVWPMRWQRACACTSFCGFQSESKMITVSAAVRLMPTPPARVLSRKTNESGSRLNLSIDSCRALPVMRPSSRSQGYPRYSQNSSNRSSTRTIWLKKSTLWPSRRSLGSSLSTRTIFPLLMIRPCSTLFASSSSYAFWVPRASRPSARPSSARSRSISKASTPSVRKGWLQHLRSSIWMFISFGSAPFVPLKRKAWLRSKMAR
mmetsp:Transcript_59220/g.86684  ORF Transcript_59220/g.86684 Transcript_59220/m.86684 type:complete len:206 (-) Transcript_59220:239-856(-)